MKSQIAKAFAPATVANVAVGFDILGFAIENLGEYVTLEKIKSGVVLEPIEGYPHLSLDIMKNCATAGLVQLIQDKNLKFGFKVRLQKNIPVGSGLGGSSTSAAATIVAAQAFLKKKLTPSELLNYALIGEEVASGSQHADNIAPCLEGGLVYVQSEPNFKAHRIKIPTSLRCVIILPELTIFTRDSRGKLSPTVSLRDMIKQTSHLAGFILGCANSDFDLIRHSLKDSVIEPQRAKMIPGFENIQAAALAAGALGCSISGSGPAIFALAPNTSLTSKIKKAMLAAAMQSDLKIRGHWVSAIAKKGAHLVGGKK